MLIDVPMIFKECTLTKRFKKFNLKEGKILGIREMRIYIKSKRPTIIFGATIKLAIMI